MRTFNYERIYKSLLVPEIVALITQIHEYKGEQMLFIEAESDSLTHLVEIAKIQSTEASNKIEGIYTSDERLRKLVNDKTLPKTRNEKEIAGYRDVLNTIHQNHDFIPLKSSIILQLHRDLYKFNGMNIGGNYKNVDNLIEEEDAQGNKSIRFRPAAAWETPEAMKEICQTYDYALNQLQLDPLLLIPIFILDFLCIHPFRDGNGRMSRLLTLLLLYRSGYIVGKYVSIEKMIERTKETYYDTLRQSSVGWHEEENDYIPFVRYLLGMIVAAYREFSERVKLLTTSGLSKPERIETLIKESLGKITKAEIIAKCPDISQVTIQRTLGELLKSGRILKISGGRYTAYIWNRENEQ